MPFLKISSVLMPCNDTYNQYDDDKASFLYEIRYCEPFYATDNGNPINYVRVGLISRNANHCSLNFSEIKLVKDAYVQQGLDFDLSIEDYAKLIRIANHADLCQHLFKEIITDNVTFYWRNNKGVLKFYRDGETKKIKLPYDILKDLCSNRQFHGFRQEAMYSDHWCKPEWDQSDSESE